MPISRRQLAASLWASDHICDRNLIASFILHPATQAAPNPFPQTSAGAVRQVWRQRAAEFQSFAIQAVGLSCLMTTVSGMGVHEALVQEILRAGAHTANVFHHGDGCQIVGAVLYGKAGVDLPSFPEQKLKRADRPYAHASVLSKQLDLFTRI